jgi:NADH-quinone oxidoreductase subunit F
MEDTGKRIEDSKWVVKVGLASCGIAAGGRKVYEAFDAALYNQNVNNVDLKRTGCFGMCYNEVLVEVSSPTGERIFYKTVKPEYADQIIAKHILDGKPINEWIIPALELNSLLAKQKRIVLRNCGVIDPESIEDYLSVGGYEAIKQVLNTKSPQDVIGMVTRSGLRGRGGAGFSTGMKWKLCREASGFQKYIICNADEGDPGAFMNRSVLESDPHSVIEGMLIGGYAIGATEGFIYVRAEYPLAVQRLGTCHRSGQRERPYR